MPEGVDINLDGYSSQEGTTPSYKYIHFKPDNFEEYGLTEMLDELFGKTDKPLGIKGIQLKIDISTFRLIGIMIEFEKYYISFFEGHDCFLEIIRGDDSVTNFYTFGNQIDSGIYTLLYLRFNTLNRMLKERFSLYLLLFIFKSFIMYA